MMQREQNERIFQEGFRELHGADRWKVPHFERMWQAAASARSDSAGFRSSGRFIRVLAGTVAATLALFVATLVPTPCGGPGLEGDGAVGTSVAEWHLPTAFLLEYPGQEMVTSVPSLGGWDLMEGDADNPARAPRWNE